MFQTVEAAYINRESPTIYRYQKPPARPMTTSLFHNILDQRHLFEHRYHAPAAADHSGPSSCQSTLWQAGSLNESRSQYQQRSTFNLQPSTFNFQLSTFNSERGPE
jgi:hypothetical protein